MASVPGARGTISVGPETGAPVPWVVTPEGCKPACWMFGLSESGTPKAAAPPAASTPAVKPDLSESLRLAPLSKLMPAVDKPAVTPATPTPPIAAPKLVPAIKGPRYIPTAMVAMVRTIGLLSIFLVTLVTDLTTFLAALNIFLMKNSGKPVTGLIVPDPPIRLSIIASCGVI